MIHDHDADTFCPDCLAAEWAWVEEQTAREHRLDAETEADLDAAVYRSGEPD